MPVGIDTDRDAEIDESSFQHFKVTEQTLVFRKEKRSHLTGGIVDGTMKSIFFAVVFEPGKRSGVNLQKKPCLGFSGAPSVRFAARVKIVQVKMREFPISNR